MIRRFSPRLPYCKGGATVYAIVHELTLVSCLSLVTAYIMKQRKIKQKFLTIVVPHYCAVEINEIDAAFDQ